MANLEFETTRNGTAAVVAASGELDLPGAELLETELERLATEAGLRTIVLDLRGLVFMDSSGLRTVVVADHEARAAGRRLAIARGPETVHRVFEITRMVDRLEFVDDPQELTP